MVKIGRKYEYEEIPWISSLAWPATSCQKTDGFFFTDLPILLYIWNKRQLCNINCCNLKSFSFLTILVMQQWDYYKISGEKKTCPKNKERWSTRLSSMPCVFAAGRWLNGLFSRELSDWTTARNRSHVYFYNNWNLCVDLHFVIFSTI